MKRNHQLLLLIPVAILMIAFSSFSTVVSENVNFSNYAKMDGGSYFLLITKGTGTETPDTGGAVFVKIKFLTIKDSAFIDINKESHNPSYPMRMDKSAYKGDFLDMFSRLHVGDSAKFFLSLDSCQKYFPDEFTFDPQFDTMKYLGMAVKIDSIYSREKVVALRAKADIEQKKQQEMMEKIQVVMEPIQANAKAKESKLKTKDAALLKKYLKANPGFMLLPNENGLYYKETLTGSGTEITPGMVVAVWYVGKYLDGTIFDANTLVEGQEPMYFHLGTDPMIQGFTDGVARMKVGGKSTFIIPPVMGYNDSLTRVFDVEVISAK
jgi:FKBP-type peptidyl-prolyl cis-trans isomerase FkpA